MPTYADMLRGNRTMGALGALSGDKVLQPFGQKLVNQNSIKPKDAISLQSAIEARRVRASQGAERLRDARTRTELWAKDLGVRRQDARTKAEESARQTDLLRGIQQGQLDATKQRDADKKAADAAKLAQDKAKFQATLTEKKAARAQRTNEAINNYGLKLMRFGQGVKQWDQKVGHLERKAKDDMQWKADVLAQRADETEQKIGIKEATIERFLNNDKVANEQWKATFDQRERKQADANGIAVDKLQEYRNENARREDRFKAEQEQESSIAADKLQLGRDKFDQGVANDATRQKQVNEDRRLKLQIHMNSLGAKYASLLQRKDLAKMSSQEMDALAAKHDLKVENLQRLKDRDATLKQQAEDKIRMGREADAQKLGVDVLEWASTMQDRAAKNAARASRNELAKRKHSDTLELNYAKLEKQEEWRDRQEKEWTQKRQQNYSDLLAREGAKDGRLGKTLAFRREQEQRMKTAQTARDERFYDKMKFTALEKEKDREFRRELAAEKRLADELESRPVKRQDRDAILQSTNVIDGLEGLLSQLENEDSQVKPLSAFGVATAPKFAQKWMHDLARSETKAGDWLPESYADMNWMQDYKNIFSMYERHKLFGAALTKVELPEWESAVITPSTSVEARKEWLKKWIKRARNNAVRLKKTMDSENYNPVTLDLMLPYDASTTQGEK